VVLEELEGVFGRGGPVLEGFEGGSPFAVEAGGGGVGGGVEGAGVVSGYAELEGGQELEVAGHSGGPFVSRRGR